MIRIKLIIEKCIFARDYFFQEKRKIHFYVKSDGAVQLITINDFSLSLPYILAKKERSIF